MKSGEDDARRKAILSFRRARAREGRTCPGPLPGRGVFRPPRGSPGELLLATMHRSVEHVDCNLDFHGCDEALNETDLVNASSWEADWEEKLAVSMNTGALRS